MRKNEKAMIEHAKDNYKYKHQFATLHDIFGTDSKYDKSAYRFALVTSRGNFMDQTKIRSDGTTSITVLQPIFQYYIYDRLEGKAYPALSRGSSLIMWAFKGAIKRIN